jgi:hypothetical protein
VLLCVAETVVTVGLTVDGHTAAVTQALGEATLDADAVSELPWPVSLFDARLAVISAAQHGAGVSPATRATALNRVALELVLRLDARVLLPPATGGGAGQLETCDALADAIGHVTLTMTEAAVAAELLGADGLLQPNLVSHLVRLLVLGSESTGDPRVSFERLVDACPPLLQASIWGARTPADVLAPVHADSPTRQRHAWLANFVTAGQIHAATPPSFSTAHAAGRALFAQLATSFYDGGGGLDVVWQRCVLGLASSHSHLFEEVLAVVFDCVLLQLGAEVGYGSDDQNTAVVAASFSALTALLAVLPSLIHIFDPSDADTSDAVLQHREYHPIKMAADDCRRALLFFGVLSRCDAVVADAVMEEPATLPLILRLLVTLLSSSNTADGYVLSARALHVCTEAVNVARERCGGVQIAVTPTQYGVIEKVAPFLLNAVTRDPSSTTSGDGKNKLAAAASARRWFTPTVATALLDLAREHA